MILRFFFARVQICFPHLAPASAPARFVPAGRKIFFLKSTLLLKKDVLYYSGIKKAIYP